MIDWYPLAKRNEAPRKLWGTYTGGPYKGVLHTTETDSFSPHPDSYGGWHNNYPHFTVLLISFKGGEQQVWVYQHIPLSRAARALKNAAGGVQTNTDKAIQIEIVWRASNAQNMPKILLDALGHLMRWIESQTGIKRQSYDSFHFYPPENGARLGHEPWRMPDEVWDDFNGWCGHQHVEEGNEHGDPGKIDINYTLSVGVPQHVVEDSLMLHSEIVTIPPVETAPENGKKRQLASLKGKMLMADKVAHVSVRAQNFGIMSDATVQKADYAGILVLSFASLSGGVAPTGNVLVDVTYVP